MTDTYAFEGRTAGRRGMLADQVEAQLRAQRLPLGATCQWYERAAHFQPIMEKLDADHAAAMACLQARYDRAVAEAQDAQELHEAIYAGDVDAATPLADQAQP